MYYTYVLLLSNRDLYKGSTGDLETRLIAHHSGKVDSTKNFIPLSLIHYECYLLKSDAERRENFLKTTEGKRLLRQQIKDVLIKLKKNKPL